MSEVINDASRGYFTERPLHGAKCPPFFRIPPFPGRRTDEFAVQNLGLATPVCPEIIGEIRRLRVGGTYWASQPNLPANYSLVRDSRAWEVCKGVVTGSPLLWERGGDRSSNAINAVIVGECDPWHILESAACVVAGPDDEVRVVASLLGVPTFIFDPRGNRVKFDCTPAAELLGKAIGGVALINPFSGEEMSLFETVEMSGAWRKLIDANRDISAAVGFAFWKQDSVAPLLWNGSKPIRFIRKHADIPRNGSVAVWRARASPDMIASLEESCLSLIEVEDGFLRSNGLGADCVPPLSITVDHLAPYFDPSGASELELLLEHEEIEPSLLLRAKALRQKIVSAGLTKYGSNTEQAVRPAGDRLHVLVAGQVEDDRSVQAGGCGLVSNLELLQRVRQTRPDAYILYRPHPDVVAGHRLGDISSRECLLYADEIVSNGSITGLIDMVDEVHVNTSLSGFEALMRGKAVSTYGVPFYAGWGLTCDHGPVPARRTRKRTLDELVAATLLIYPRYLDPKTGLPCPAEVAAARLIQPTASQGLIVAARRLQGKLMRRVRGTV